MAKVKFVMISTVVNDSGTFLYGLDDAGQVWINSSPYPGSTGMWEKVDAPEAE